MKILVGVKRVIDHNVNIRVKSDGSAVETDNVKMSINPFDEIAVEEAVRLKEAGHASEVIAVSVGVAKSEETLRTALAMGADRAILIESEQSVEPLNIAKLLKAVAEKEGANLVVLGKQAIDNDANQTGQMLAAVANWSQATFASKVEVEGEQLQVTREVDGGLEKIKVKLPSVVTVDLRLNEPRFASLPNIMKAKKKPLEKLAVSEFGIDISPRLSTVSICEPEKRQAGIKVADVAELVDKLRNEAKVI